MAIIRNIWLKGAHKRVGGAVLYTSQGRTIVREAAASVKNPRTVAQMAQRVKWANLVNFYRVNSSWMDKAFENKKRNQSAYNRFMQLNASISNIYLTKQDAEQGVTIPIAYTMSEGSLPTLPVTGGEGDYKLTYDGQTTTVENPTLQDFSNFMVNSPWSFNYGDQFSIIYVRCLKDVNGSYYCDVKKEEVILNDSSLMSINDMLVNCRIHLNNGVMTFTVFEDNICVCMIHSVDKSGKIYVSTQQLAGTYVISGIIDKFSSSQQFAAAVVSYGGNSEYFLDPKDSTGSTSIFEGITFDHIEGNSGEILHIGDFVKGKNISTMEVFFNKNLPMPCTECIAIFKGNASGLKGFLSGTHENRVYVEFPKMTDEQLELDVMQITMKFNNAWYFLRFNDESAVARFRIVPDEMAAKLDEEINKISNDKDQKPAKKSTKKD